MLKAIIELFMKNQQSTDTTLERVKCSIAGITDRVDTLETGFHRMIKQSLPRILVRTTMKRRRTSMSPSAIHVHHHNISTATTSMRTKSFHVLCIDQIGKVWEVTLIVALINNMLMVMMILLLKLSLLFLLLCFV
jgi:hypothetical protein